MERAIATAAIAFVSDHGRGPSSEEEQLFEYEIEFSLNEDNEFEEPTEDQIIAEVVKQIRAR